jgi:hypothetical protein
LATPTLARAPAGHKKTASTKWGGTRTNESQNALETAATAFQSFRRAAGWAAPRIIHWRLSAFTVQNYEFLFRCNNLPAKKHFLQEFLQQGFKSQNPSIPRALPLFQAVKKSWFFLTACPPNGSHRNFGCLFR